MSVRRERRKAVTRGRPTSPVLVAIRERRAGSRSLYHQAVADRPIDREAWAALIAALITSETKGKKATFARLVGVDPKTIGHWLAGNVEVSEQSVRRVAAALDRPPMDLLVAVGYYRPDELTQPPPEVADEPDPEIAAILAAPVGPVQQKRMLELLFQMRERDRRRRMEDIAFLLERDR